MYLIFDIGGSSTKVGIFDKSGNIIYKSKSKSKTSYEDFLLDMKKWIDFSKQKGKLEKISISSPGMVDIYNKKSMGLTALGYLDNDFVTELERYSKLERSDILIENDGNCGALGELFFDKNIRNYIYIVIGTGIGGAVIIDRKLYRGSNFSAGEFGYMLLGTDNSNFSTLGTLPNVCKKLEKDKNISVDTFEMLKKHKLKQEPYYSYVEDMFNILARGIYNLYYCFDPEKIIIGGAISEDKYYMEKLKEKLNEKAYSYRKIDLISSKNFNENNLYGAFYNIIGKKYEN